MNLKLQHLHYLEHKLGSTQCIESVGNTCECNRPSNPHGRDSFSMCTTMVFARSVPRATRHSYTSSSICTCAEPAIARSNSLHSVWSPGPLIPPATTLQSLCCHYGSTDEIKHFFKLFPTKLLTNSLEVIHFTSLFRFQLQEIHNSWSTKRETMSWFKEIGS